VTAIVDLRGRSTTGAAKVQQLRLPLSARDPVAAHDDALLISDANREAWRALENWAAWPTPIAVLEGPARSGKSLLAAQFAGLCPAAQIIDPAEATDEAALFHACNRALASGEPLLIVHGGDAEGWQVGLPDLATRIAAALHLSVEQPDSALFAALLIRRLARSGIPILPEVAHYVADRVERTYAELDAVADLLARTAREDGERMTMPVVRRVLSVAGRFHATGDDSAAA
jgi:hypothetical protein